MKIIYDKNNRISAKINIKINQILNFNYKNISNLIEVMTIWDKWYKMQINFYSR